MNTHDSNLKTCPLCGKESQITILNHPSKTTYNVSCGVEDDDSDTCGLVLFGGSRDTYETMKAKWNKRITGDSDNG